MWLKNRCATDVTRVARGFIARIGIRQERQRLTDEEEQRFAAEEHAVTVAGDVAVTEALAYLAGEALGACVCVYVYVCVYVFMCLFMFFSRDVLVLRVCWAVFSLSLS